MKPTLNVLLLGAAARFATALPAYKIPIAMVEALLANHDCVMPKGFAVANFQIWTPSPGNNQTEFINFDYSDNSTTIDTKCHFNESSVDVGPEGLAPRYRCDDPIVEFIWRNGTLTLIEKACPQSQGSRGFEAAGSVWPDLWCGTSERNSSVGEGTSCVAVPESIAANFTSLQPSPE